jgi:hypothetical protein
LHDDLDLAAPTADQTPSGAEARTAAVKTLLERLLALNAKRAAEEAAGTVRWLRPDFQQRGLAGAQSTMDVSTDEPEAVAAPAAPAVKRSWPTGLPEQIKAVADVLATSAAPLALPDLEARFTARGRWRERLPVILDTLEALGRARRPQAGIDRWQAA